MNTRIPQVDIQSSFSRLPEFVYFFTSKFRQTTCPAVVHSLNQSSKKSKEKSRQITKKFVRFIMNQTLNPLVKYIWLLSIYLNEPCFARYSERIVQPEPFAPQFWGTKQSFIRYLCYSSILSQTPTLGAETITNCNS
ncbi:hypothetical protein BANAU_1127 [Bacillus velezensis YAU B9601-Y2]|nr:hypothetical protein BANAU_1127 [Bacillus velezensis YAU B9601-Y2]